MISFGAQVFTAGYIQLVEEIHSLNKVRHIKY